MSITAPRFEDIGTARSRGRIGGLGAPGTMLLSGPAEEEGAETLRSHLTRFGQPSADMSPAGIRAQIRASGLQGRGGGGFPIARKLETALLGSGEPVLIVNGGESEPASRKDGTICTYRPQLVLDGAAATAKAIGALEVVVYLHQGPSPAAVSMTCAMDERAAFGLDDPCWRVAFGPDRYVAGEASAVARFVETGVALPLFSTHPMALRGPSGRPTVVSNAETMAHVGLLARLGAPTWRAGGTDSMPGSQLITLVGGVPRSGAVVEVVGEASIGEILASAGVLAPPAAVLIGGFAGTCVHGDRAWNTTFSPHGLREVGAHRGCGLIAVLPHGACGVTEVARLVDYLAGESAGQCGPCVLGLPAVARSFSDLARGSLGSRGLRQMRRTADMLVGSGACSHPDGVVQLVRSALQVFEDDVVRHLAGRPCRAAAHPPVFQVPGVPRHGRGGT